jgi:hypothetical protein
MAASSRARLCFLGFVRSQVLESRTRVRAYNGTFTAYVSHEYVVLPVHVCRVREFSSIRAEQRRACSSSRRSCPQSALTTTEGIARSPMSLLEMGAQDSPLMLSMPSLLELVSGGTPLPLGGAGGGDFEGTSGSSSALGSNTTPRFTPRQQSGLRALLSRVSAVKALTPATASAAPGRDSASRPTPGSDHAQPRLFDASPETSKRGSDIEEDRRLGDLLIDDLNDQLSAGGGVAGASGGYGGSGGGGGGSAGPLHAADDDDLLLDTDGVLSPMGMDLLESLDRQYVADGVDLHLEDAMDQWYLPEPMSEQEQRRVRRQPDRTSPSLVTTARRRRARTHAHGHTHARGRVPAAPARVSYPWSSSDAAMCPTRPHLTVAAPCCATHRHPPTPRAHPTTPASRNYSTVLFLAMDMA